MKKATLIILAALVTMPLFARAASQDHWFYEKYLDVWTDAEATTKALNTRHLVIGESNTLYTVEMSQKYLLRLDTDGNVVDRHSASTHDGNVHGLAVGPGGNIFEQRHDGNWNTSIHEFTPDLTPVRTISINNVIYKSQITHGFDIDSEGRFFILDYDRDGSDDWVTVLDPDGEFITRWRGDPDNLEQKLTAANTLQIAPNGDIYVADGSYIKVFTPGGTFIERFNTSVYSYDLAFTPDGCLLQQTGDWTYFRDSRMRQIGLSPFLYYTTGMKSDSSGDMWVLRSYGNVWSYIYKLRRSTYSFPTEAANSLPLPEVLSINQREGTGIIDVDYRVLDMDDETVETAALAFFDGDESFSKAVPVQTLIEGTRDNLGSGVSTSEIHRLTWDLAADVASNVVPVAVKIMARDSSPMLSFDFIVIPSNGPDPELVINRVPLFHSDLVPLYDWLVATEDPAVTLAGGRVVGTSDAGATYDGQELASGRSTTALGRDFLFERLNVRLATGAEVQRAQEASTPGTVIRDQPRKNIEIWPLGSNQYRERPEEVNEYGFDTYQYWSSYSSWHGFVVRD